MFICVCKPPLSSSCRLWPCWSQVELAWGMCNGLGKGVKIWVVWLHGKMARYVGAQRRQSRVRIKGLG